MYIHNDEDGFIPLVLFFSTSVASFFTHDVLAYLGGVGICYWIWGLVTSCIRVWGMPLITQVDDLLQEKPYMPLQFFHILYGILLGFLTYKLPMQEYVIGGDMVTTHIFYFVSVGYFLWGITRLMHNWDYYQNEFRKVK